MPAKHLLTARTAGPEAGLEAFLRAPISKLHQPYREIVGNGRRSKATMLKAYCNLYGDAISRVRVPKGTVVVADPDDEDNGVMQDRTSSDRQELIESLVALLGANDSATLISQIAELTNGGDETEDDGYTVVHNDEYITTSAAWEALGGGEEFRPSDPSDYAREGQLWRLNRHGLLSLNS